MQDNLARRKDEISQPKVRIAEGKLLVELESGLTALPLIALPEKFVEWIEQGRKSMYDKLQGKGNPGFFTSHLPVMVTQSQGVFPFNSSNKGVGYLPKPEYLQEFIELFRSTIGRTKGRPWQESMQERIAAVSSFYFDREKIDYRALSSLEIFEKTTFQNLSKTPLSALHYTGNGPDYVSFQANCVVEIIGPDDPRHEFVKLARVMFEYDSFHISQHQFPYAYVFWISEVIDKTPFRVPEKGNVITLPTKGGMKWDPEAIESINRAPGMIRQFITDGIEKYAKERGYTEITMKLVREAREVLERPRPGTSAPEGNPHVTPEKSASKDEGSEAARKYHRIYVGLDSSALSNEAMALGVEIGKRDGAEMIGSHVYAAKMHDNRFRAMEGGLPEEFQKEKELNRQRKIHDSLITKGLELITDSYLEGMAAVCKDNALAFTANSLEGKNWKAIVEDVNANKYDLVMLGAHGIGRVGHSQLGTVAERVLRRVRCDTFLCKRTAAENQGDSILVCLDGSTRSWGGLERAIALAKSFGKKVVAVSAFDPYFHYAMFKSLNKTLTEKARKVFKFEEQEKLHEDIIDSGLAKIYQSYLNIAKRLAGEGGVEIETHLLDGKPFEKIIHFVEKNPPWLLVVGRIGFHSEEDMDIGGNTENLCRLAPCNILVVDHKAKPPVEFQAEETVSWTVEARAKMQRIPAMAQGMATKAIQNYCLAEGFTVVTESVLNAAIKTILPPEALKRMGLVGDAGPVSESQDKIALSFKCQACGHVHHGSRPQLCPICGMGGHIFKLVESAVVEDGQVLEALGDRQLIWEKPALAALDGIADATVRAQVRNKLEKKALSQRLTAVTLEMVKAETGTVETPMEPHAGTGLTNNIAPAVFSEALHWTEEAVKRLERVPDGFMRKAAKTMVEQHAKGIDSTTITLEIAEAGLGKAREKMHASAAAQASAAGSSGAASPHASHSKPHGIDSQASAPPNAQPHATEPPSPHPQAWECHQCGLIVDGDKPGICINCHTERYIKLSAAERAKAFPSALRILEWDKEALERLERVPMGFSRDLTRNRVEKWARAEGSERVTMAIMDAKYGGWTEGTAKVTLELAWSEPALVRAARIPAFIRPGVQKEIEKRVKAAGKTAVDVEDLNEAIKEWTASGDFHGHG